MKMLRVKLLYSDVENREELKAFGWKWNRELKCWETEDEERGRRQLNYLGLKPWEPATAPAAQVTAKTVAQSENKNGNGWDQGFINRIISEALSLPDELLKELERLFEWKEELEGIGKSMELWEMQEIIKIQNETNSDGQKLYTNEAARRAALELHKEQDESYQRLKERYAQIKYQVEHQEMLIERLRFKMRALEIIAKLIDYETNR